MEFKINYDFIEIKQKTKNIVESIYYAKFAIQHTHI
jgi:hypothetical protein